MALLPHPCGTAGASMRASSISPADIAHRAGQIPALQAEAMPLLAISIDAIPDRLLARKTAEGD